MHNLTLKCYCVWNTSTSYETRIGESAFNLSIETNRSNEPILSNEPVFPTLSFTPMSYMRFMTSCGSRFFPSSQNALWLRGLHSHYCKKKRIYVQCQSGSFLFWMHGAHGNNERLAGGMTDHCAFFTLRWIWCRQRVNWCFRLTLILID